MVPFWKELLSRIGDVPLERAATEYNPDVELNLRNGRYLLTTPNAIYSYGDLYLNFFEAFRRLKPQKRAIRDVLVLGLGMGSIPWMLEKKFGRVYHYTCVEIDEVIAGWAMKYTVPELKSPLTIYTADAVPFAHQCTQRFDLVCVDLFLDEHVPDELDEPEFSEALSRLLTENGLLLWNRLADKEALIHRTTSFYDEVFSKIFDDAHILTFEGNWMLLNRHPENNSV